MVCPSSSKHAVIGLTKSLGVELAADNILVNCVCAGIVDTPMWDLIDGAAASRFLNDVIAHLQSTQVFITWNY